MAAEALSTTGPQRVAVGVVTRPTTERPHRNRTPMATVRSISVIIPTRDEAGTVAAVVRRAGVLAGVCEVIVSDGGSSDGTRTRAEQAGACVLRAPRTGRGPQQNHGAAWASGDILLFLHADTWLPSGAGRSIQCALADPRRVGGAFKRRFTGSEVGAALACTSRLADLRCRWWGLGYGDQALFVRRDAFHAVGGFPESGLDDVGLSQRLRHLAGKPGFALVGPPIYSSARRFRHRPLKRVLSDGIITTGLVARALAGGRLCS